MPGSHRTLMLHKPFKILVCLVTLAAFVSNMIVLDIAWAGGLQPSKELHVGTFSLPEELGRIGDRYSADGRNKNVVIHIQDAHCNYAAQHKIAEIIEYLNREYGIRTVNLEGGAKGYDLSVFTGIADTELRKKAADYFVKEGLVNGAEYFAVTDPGKIILWGVEDTSLYIDALTVYRDSLAHKDEVNADLKILSQLLSRIKTEIFSKELLAFDRQYGAYKAHAIEFKEYLGSLIALAKEKSVGLETLPDVYLLDQALTKESGVDFKKANSERDGLVDELRKRLSRNALAELTARSVAFRAEKISAKDFYAYLTAVALKNELSLSPFPAFRAYVAYLSL